MKERTTMRQYTRPPVMLTPVNSLAKELDFCFDQNGSMYFLLKDNEAVFDSKSLEEINGFLLGFKYGFKYSKKTCNYCKIDYKKAVEYGSEVEI
jgi:hypothetical protein